MEQGYAIGLAVLTACLSYGLTQSVVKWAVSRKLFSSPVRSRDSHTNLTPRVGGLAITISLALMIGLVIVLWPDALRFTGSLVSGIDRNLLGMLLGGLVLGLVNVFDDLNWRGKGVNWPVRLAAQFVAASIVAYFGIKIQWLSNPFGNTLALGAFDAAAVVIWLVVIMNVVNWIDGIDGLAGGVGSIALLILFFLSSSPLVNQPANALLAILAAGAVLGFLPLNLKGKVFLGDVGSMILGFVIGVTAIISGGKLTTVFLVLAIPFLDAAVVFFGRIFSHHSPFEADRRHLHHRLLAMGWSKKQIILGFYAISLLFGLLALNTDAIGKFWALIVAVVLMFGLVLVYSRKLKKANA